MTTAKVLTSIAAVCLWVVQAMAADGLITLRSRYSPKETMQRLETEVKAKGLTVLLVSITRPVRQKLDCHCGQPSF